MQVMHREQPTPEELLLIRPLSYVLEMCGSAQTRVAREEKLNSLQVTFLRFAAWKGMVSFDRVAHETGLPRYAISRAAAELERRGFGKVKRDQKSWRWKRLHITGVGLKCCQRIDKAILSCVLNKFQQNKEISYYTFASYIYNSARCLPDPLQVTGQWKFPDAIVQGSELNVQQKELIGFLQEIERDLKFLQRRRRQS
jgi:DNA-binding MarR family transcriptional regulator